MTRIALTDEEVRDLARFVDLFNLIRLFPKSFVEKVREARERMEKRCS